MSESKKSKKEEKEMYVLFLGLQKKKKITVLIFGSNFVSPTN